MSDFYVCLRCSLFSKFRFCRECGAKGQSEDELIRYDYLPTITSISCRGCGGKMIGNLEIDNSPSIHFYCDCCGCDYYEPIGPR